MQPQWNFRVKTAQEMNQSPQHGELFDSNEDLDQRALLVREVLQNSIDAKVDGGPPVAVAFQLGTIADPAAAGLEDLLAEPARRVSASHPAAAEDVRLDRPMRCLVVEDFNTAGLDGDVSRWTLAGADTHEGRFFYFWRNIGRSGKVGGSLGSWGLGKAVYYKASVAGTYFGLTHRAADGETNVMGLSLVGAHEINGTLYDYYGYWGVPSHASDVPVLPSMDSHQLQRFKDAFGLQRDLSTESGLSVVVPWLDDAGWRADPSSPEWTAAALAKAAIEQFYLPIAQGVLVLEFNDERESYVVTAKSIDDVARAVGAFGDEGEADRRLALARTWIQGNASVTIELPRLDLDYPGMHRWNGTAEMERIRVAWEKNGLVIVRVPLTLKSKQYGLDDRGVFSILIERDEGLAKGKVDFFREGMKVPGVTAPRFVRARALVLVQRDGIGRMLGEAENPAHTKWGDEKKLIEAGYKYRRDNVAFVRKAPSELLGMLTVVDEQQDTVALVDLFPRPAATGADMPQQSPKKGPGRRRKRRVIEEVPPIPPARPQQFRIDGRAAGFRVTSTNEAPDAVRIQAGYVGGQNPFRTPKPKDILDFDFARPGAEGIVIEPVNATIEVVAPNEFILRRVREGRFEVDVSGFDTNRDVAVRTLKAVEQ